MLPKAGDSWNLEEAAHLLNRAGFGGNPNDIRKYHAMGRRRAVESLISGTDAPGDFPLPEWATEERALADMRMRIQQRRESMQATAGLSAEQAEKVRREMFREAQQENRRHALEMQGWWFRRILHTKAPLREKMTLFWHDHFASSIQKVKQPMLMLKQNELFRQHALGSFHELTQAIVTDPAMMLYLDTQNSRKGMPNENFAREVMELFTLGEGQYSEDDIREAARAFTGYKIDRFSGKVTHVSRQWDDGTKTIFGKTGKFDGGDVVNLIFGQPEVPRFIAEKIWEFFAYENPSERAVDALAGILRQSDFNVTPLLREIFLSREFYSEAAMRTQIKSPVQFIVQLIKQLEIGDPPTGFPILAQQQLGQVLFMPPNVAGWDWGQAWINTNTLLTRYNLAGTLTKGNASALSEMAGGRDKSMRGGRFVNRSWQGPDYEKIAPRPLRENPAELVDSLVFRFFQGPVPDKARSSFLEYATAKKGVVFTNNEVAELCHLMLSTPYYQLC